jgi:hypothetical protein
MNKRTSSEVADHVLSILTPSEEWPEWVLEEEAEELLAEEEEILASEEDNETRKNIFANGDSGWDYNYELSTRTPEEPYVIHVDEYIADEMGYDQRTLVYYSGDDVMTDHDDQVVFPYNTVVGELKFGHGSKDPAVVYVRNEMSETEYEIMLHTGLFKEEVLGLEVEREYARQERAELKHSRARFRED